jgi:hypothetical protein
MTRVDIRVAMSGGSVPFHNYVDAFSHYHVVSRKQYERLSINPWRGRVAVLLERGMPRLPQKRRSAMNSSDIVSSEITPRRKAVIPRVEKNRPFHAWPITGVFN